MCMNCEVYVCRVRSCRRSCRQAFIRCRRRRTRRGEKPRRNRRSRKRKSESIGDTPARRISSGLGRRARCVVWLGVSLVGRKCGMSMSACVCKQEEEEEERRKAVMLGYGSRQ
jgi:hypothetical protein